MKTESAMMIVARAAGLERVAWALRRLYCPVPKEALVLEVGSGGNPYPRANVLLDAYEETRERHWVPLKADRPLVLGFVERLPFRDKVFDFVIASHVLEHSADPEAFLGELQRVAKAGYIEVPDAFFERLIPYPDHRLEITSRGGRLLIRKKAKWRVEESTAELCLHAAARFISGELIPSRPFAFHTRYYWEGRIDFEILNPETDASWKAIDYPPVAPPAGLLPKLKKLGLDCARELLSQGARNAGMDLVPLLACPACRGTGLSRVEGGLRCGGCGALYAEKNGIPAMYAADKGRV